MDIREDNTFEIQLTKCELISTYYNEEISEANTPGDRLRSARIENKMSIIDLATVSDLSVTTISGAENNRIILQPKNIKLLSSLLYVPIYYLGCYDLLPENTLGQRIKKSRLYYGQTIKDYSIELKVDEHTLGDWEADKRIPSSENLTKLSKKLSILE